MQNDLKLKQRNNSELLYYILQNFTYFHILQLHSILHTLQNQHTTKLYSQVDFTT